MRLGTWALGAALVVGLGGCGDDPIGVIEETPFAPELGIDLDQMTRLESGVYIQTLEPGEGTIDVDGNETVVVDYQGWLANGALFDERAAFELDLQTTLPGFRIGVTNMLIGELRRIIIPPELGYGDAGFGPVPPRAVLVFEVRVLEIQGDPEGG